MSSELKNNNTFLGAKQLEFSARLPWIVEAPLRSQDPKSALNLIFFFLLP